MRAPWRQDHEAQQAAVSQTVLEHIPATQTYASSHRFKNELMGISAMLRLQQRSIEDRLVSSALSSTADRVQVLARLHERLQRSSTTAVVDTREFISALCEDLQRTIELRPIALEVRAESHLLTQQRAVPVGLIINELLANALNPDFPVEMIPAKRRRQVKLFRQGELGRAILDALRKADGKPLSVAEITAAIIAAKGYGEASRPALAPRVRGNLTYLSRQRGAVIKSGDRAGARWALAI